MKVLPALGIGDDKICGFLRYPAPQLRMGARSAETDPRCSRMGGR